MTFSDVRRPLPAHDPDKQAARVLASSASYLAKGWPDGAEIGAKRILADYPQTPAAADAKVMLDRVLYIKPLAVPHGNNNTPAKQALFSGRHLISRNTFDAARLYLDRVVTLKPDSREGKEAAAWIAWMDDHPDQARRKPTTPAVLAVIVFQSGLAYEREGRAAEAKAAYQRVLRDYPGTPSADAARKMLAKNRDGATPLNWVRSVTGGEPRRGRNRTGRAGRGILPLPPWVRLGSFCCLPQRGVALTDAAKPGTIGNFREFRSVRVSPLDCQRTHRLVPS